MYKNILIINLMYIGDILFMTPFIRTLHANYPDSNISMMIDSKNVDLLKFNPHLSEIIPIEKKGYHNKPVNYFNLIRQIRKKKFDLVINLHPNERASAIAAFSGAPKKLGLSANLFKVFFHKLAKHNDFIHQVDAYLDVLQSVLNLNIVDNQGLEMWIDENTIQKTNNLWQEFFPDSSLKTIGLNTGGSWPTKRWTRQGYAALADRLLDNGHGVVFFGGSVDLKDVNEILDLMKNKSHKNLAVLTAKISLLELAVMMKKCAVIISGDSGPLHVAVSQRVPVLSIFGPSDPVRYAPYNFEDSVISSERECLKCGLHKCETHNCMHDITSDLVFDRIMAILYSNTLYEKSAKMISEISRVSHNSSGNKIEKTTK